MRSATEQAAAELVEQAVSLARERHGGGELVASFIDQYWYRVAPEDIVERDAIDLHGSALAHLDLGRCRTVGDIDVRVYSPTVGDDGWQSSHSVVDCVTDDMPFIVDSVANEVTRNGYGIHLLVHPVIALDRDDDGDIQAIGRDLAATESFVHIEIDRIASAAAASELAESIRQTLLAVRVAIDDWSPMTARALAVADELASGAAGPDADAESSAETCELLHWLVDGNFVFLGYREYELMGDGPDARIEADESTGLGILRLTPAAPRAFSDLPEVGQQRIRSNVVLQITKTNSVSPVLRSVPMDYIGVKWRDPESGWIREHRFLGLFTSPVYRRSVRTIPVVRRTVQAVLERADFDEDSHDANRLMAILEGHPRDEMFQIGPEKLHEFAIAILQLRERPQVKLFVRQDAFGRFVSCLVYVPRERYNTDVRLRINRVLVEAFSGTRSTFSTEMSSGPHARLHFIISTPPGAAVPSDLAALEAHVARVSRHWSDDLLAALVDQLGEDRGLKLNSRWAAAFPPAYCSEVHPAFAVSDVERLEDLGDDELHTSVTQLPGAAPEDFRFKLYRSGGPLSLSDILPVLKDLGVVVLDEFPYEIRAEDRPPAWIYDFGIRMPRGLKLEPTDRRRFEHAFEAVWSGRVESDSLASLVLSASLGWRDVALMRTYRQYLHQIGTPFSHDYIDEVLTRNSSIVARIVELFGSRFDPDHLDPDREVVIEAELEEALADVASLDEDRILRSFRALVEATVRTNHYQTGPAGEPAAYTVLKLDSGRVPDVPAPVPHREIFVKAPHVEGVHLRMGRVARGGLRASDRRDDFRTEVLGLVKAQAVKNAVIVPVGAKGGFVARQLPASGDRAAVQAEVVRAYRTFIEGMLDVTDNLVGGEVVPPDRVIRYDGDDPYLVVAADKGTATFSDIANEIACERGFWLGDAFASGGSNGYDHKAMGITARGAWESVRRHFRELGVDIDTETITAVGVGDMSGDVFGNGMLLSRHLKLVAAFDHRHVFIDPDPDPAVSYDERRRLFELPRSSWDDYDRTLISEGGGVFSRAAKSIELSEQMRTVLDVSAEVITPTELISAVLAAPVDLLWNGGVGTYVKSAQESHADAADRANDALRIDAHQLRCRVVGEGGNLGFTQLGRIEFARLGGRVNNDAIDNSAGVDCSDHEVNLKILLDGLVVTGDLTTKQRNELLQEMTDEVAELVLADNYAQNLTLAGARIQAPGMVDVHVRHMAWLERNAGLVRELEGLPTDEELIERGNSGAGLTQPELAVLLAYTKIQLAEEILASDLPDDPAFAPMLDEYFPEPVRRRFGDRLAGHQLRRELITTQITNLLVNRAGITMTERLRQETSAHVPDIARAHFVAWRVFDLDRRWTAIEELDGGVDAQTQAATILEVKRLGERATRWFLRNRRAPFDVESVVAEFADDVDRTWDLLLDVLRHGYRAELEVAAERLVEAGMPAELAREIAGLGQVITSLDIVDLARSAGRPLEQVVGVYLSVEERLGLGWLREQITRLRRDDQWQALARSALRDDFFHEHKELARQALGSADNGAAPAELVDSWVISNQPLLDRCARVLADIRASGSPGLAELSVALREFRNVSYQTEVRAD